MRTIGSAAILWAALSGSVCVCQQDVLTTDAKTTSRIATSTRVSGRVGGGFDVRVVATESSYNYKLRATWLTPEVIRATARLQQLKQRLTDEQTRALVAEAEQAGDTVIMVEIDHREGSGVIPRDWIAVLQPRGASASSAVKGASTPSLREVKALAGGAARDYSYDQFWVVFPLKAVDGSPLFGPSAREAELVVEIRGKVDHVSWSNPDSVRASR